MSFLFKRVPYKEFVFFNAKLPIIPLPSHKRVYLGPLMFLDQAHIFVLCL